MLSNLLPLLIVLVPVATGLAIISIPEQREKLRTTFNTLGALLNLGLISLLVSGVYNGQSYETRIPLLPNIDLVLHADSLSLLFVSLSALLWLLTTFYAIAYLGHAKNRSRFFGFFSFCVGATLGVALAGNLITFLIFYELLTLTTYPLIAHRGNVESLKAARVYLSYTMIGGAILLVGVVWLKSMAGALDFTSTGVLSNLEGLNIVHLQIIFALLIIGLGVKAALVPLHGWLPVSMAAPAPVSALLHAVAVVKAGAFGIIRVVYDVYGIEFARELGLTIFLAIGAGITIVYGSLRALSQDDLKKRLAYSTVSQVSYIALGASIAGPVATVGGLVHLVHQGLMKITLFFCAGNLAETNGIHKVSEMAGIGRRMPLTMLAFTVAALGMIGIPPIAGFVSKWYIGIGALESQSYWVLAVLASSSLLNACYFLPILHAAWFKPAIKEWSPAPPGQRLETHWMLLLPPTITASLALLVGMFASSSFSPLYWAKTITTREYANSALDYVLQENLLYITQHVWILIVPAIVALGLLVRPLRRTAETLIPFTALPALFLALWPELFAQVGQPALSLTDTIFLTLAAILWFAACGYAKYYMRQDQHRHRFYFFFLLAMIGNFGVILSADVAAFISFFTLMSLSAYPLILHSGEKAHGAASSYIQWVIIGEVILFAAMAGYSFNQSQELIGINNLQPTWVSLFFIVGFGIKAGLIPFHVWLPKAHPVAPIPASALLSGIMVKVGVLGWLRFLPLGDVQHLGLGETLLTLGFVGALGAAVIGVLQHNPKTVLAYSTISQMGIISAIFGVALIYNESWLALQGVILIFVLHHGLSKATLFMSVGLPYCTSRHWGFAKLLWLVPILPALALIGIPLTSGAYAKTLLKISVPETSIFLSVLPLTALGTSCLMARFIHLLAKKSKTDTSPAALHWGLLIPTLSLCLLSLTIILWLPEPLINTHYMFDFNSWRPLLWPAIIGGSLYLVVRKYCERETPLPAGDLVVIYTALGGYLTRAIATINAACDAERKDRWRGLRDSMHTNMAAIKLAKYSKSTQLLRPELVFGIVVLGFLVTLAL